MEYFKLVMKGMDFVLCFISFFLIVIVSSEITPAIKRYREEKEYLLLVSFFLILSIILFSYFLLNLLIRIKVIEVG